MQDRERAEDQVVALLAAARRRDRAPESLRARIERDRSEAGGRRSPAALPGWLGRRAYAGGLAIAVVAAALIIALAVPSGSSVLPSISEATALALRGPAAPAPAANGPVLQARVGGVNFPNWSGSLGYVAYGVRHDQIKGHPAVTVYYRRGSESVAYLIFASHARWPKVPPRLVGSLEVRELLQDGNAVVTWRRGAVTCVLVSGQLTTHELASLADWTAAARLGAARDGQYVASVA